MVVSIMRFIKPFKQLYISRPNGNHFKIFNYTWPLNKKEQWVKAWPIKSEWFWTKKFSFMKYDLYMDKLPTSEIEQYNAINNHLKWLLRSNYSEAFSKITALNIWKNLIKKDSLKNFIFSKILKVLFWIFSIIFQNGFR